jgi:lipopolysaccharide/colanic/teichoic acid biosynthesis glycosyltransferase
LQDSLRSNWHGEDIDNPMGRYGSFIKRLTDIILSSLALILSSPVLLISIIAIKIESKGDAFFIQDRTGLGGKPFKMIKLRGMIDGAEQLGPDFTQKDDPRLTRVGKILRRMSIDEIPQAINVLKGDMSIVGPRPELTKITDQFSPDQREVFNFKPGITGISQINGRQTLSPEERVVMEIAYYKDATFWSDLRIVLRTPKVVITNEGNV